MQRGVPRLRGGRLRDALPSPAGTLAGTLFWGAAMGGSAYLDVAHRADHAGILAIALLFAAGGALAFPVAFFLTRLAARPFGAAGRLAACFILLGLGTAGATALVFAAQYRIHYAASHADAFSHVWALQLFFTLLAALYQFAVVGLRLYVPYGLLALAAFSLWFALRPR